MKWLPAFEQHKFTSYYINITNDSCVSKSKARFEAGTAQLPTTEVKEAKV